VDHMLNILCKYNDIKVTLLHRSVHMT